MKAKEIQKYSDEELHEMYEDSLRECYGETVSICGLDYDLVMVFKDTDPTAYRCEFNDWEDGFSRDNQITAWECGECGEEYDNEEDAEECCKP